MLYDAVASCRRKTRRGRARASDPGATDFVADAFAHCKFIGYVAEREPLLDAAGVSPTVDDGIVLLAGNGDAVGFLERCRDLRFWERELQLVG